MTEFDALSVITRIQELLQQRGWTPYKLALKAGISYGALNKILKRPHIPTITTLSKICAGMDITLSEFFSYYDGEHTNRDNVISLWNLLDSTSKQYAIIYMKGLAKQPILQSDENI